MWDKYRQIDNYRPRRHYWTACDAEGAVLFRSPKGFKTEQGAIDDWNNTVAKIYDTGASVGESLVKGKLRREFSEKSKAAHDTAFKAGKEEGYKEGYALGKNKGADEANIKNEEAYKKLRKAAEAKFKEDLETAHWGGVKKAKENMQTERNRLISRFVQALVAVAVGAFLIGALLV